MRDTTISAVGVGGSRRCRGHADELSRHRCCRGRGRGRGASHASRPGRSTNRSRRTSRCVDGRGVAVRGSGGRHHLRSRPPPATRAAARRRRGCGRCPPGSCGSIAPLRTPRRRSSSATVAWKIDSWRSPDISSTSCWLARLPGTGPAASKRSSNCGTSSSPRWSRSMTRARRRAGSVRGPAASNHGAGSRTGTPSRSVMSSTPSQRKRRTSTRRTCAPWVVLATATSERRGGRALSPCSHAVVSPVAAAAAEVPKHAARTCCWMDVGLDGWMRTPRAVVSHPSRAVRVKKRFGEMSYRAAQPAVATPWRARVAATKAGQGSMATRCHPEAGWREPRCSACGRALRCAAVCLWRWRWPPWGTRCRRRVGCPGVRRWRRRRRGPAARRARGPCGRSPRAAPAPGTDGRPRWRWA